MELKSNKNVGLDLTLKLPSKSCVWETCTQIEFILLTFASGVQLVVEVLSEYFSVVYFYEHHEPEFIYKPENGIGLLRRFTQSVPQGTRGRTFILFGDLLLPRATTRVAVQQKLTSNPFTLPSSQCAQMEIRRR